MLKKQNHILCSWTEHLWTFGQTKQNSGRKGIQDVVMSILTRYLENYQTKQIVD